MPFHFFYFFFFRTFCLDALSLLRGKSNKSHKGTEENQVSHSLRFRCFETGCWRTPLTSQRVPFVAWVRFDSCFWDCKVSDRMLDNWTLWVFIYIICLYYLLCSLFSFPFLSISNFKSFLSTSSPLPSISLYFLPIFLLPSTPLHRSSQRCQYNRQTE